MGPLLLLLLLPLLLAPSVGVACCRGKSTTLDMVGCDESAIPYADLLSHCRGGHRVSDARVRPDAASLAGGETDQEATGHDGDRVSFACGVVAISWKWRREG